MVAVYRRHCSLPLIPQLLIMSLFDFNPLTDATKAHITNMEYSDHEGQFEFPRTVDKRTVPRDLLHKRIIDVEAQTWSNATLHCAINIKIDKRNATFSWSKRQSLLTTLEQIFIINETTTTKWVGDDKRYLAKLSDGDWCLHIRYTLNSDAGLYECLVCTLDKCTKTIVSLRLKEARAEIIGGPRKHIPKDKEVPLRLSCMLRNSIEKPDYILWYHEDRMINYDLEDGATVREGPQGSELIFPKANKTHVGNYSCVPSNAKLDSIMVYYGELPSVPQEDESSGEKTHPKDHIVNMLVLISTYYLTR